jgi:hypothetical protein
MAKVKLKKYPKKPKASASVEVMENYLRRCKEVDKENNKRKSDKKKAETKKKTDKAKKENLRKKIAGIGRAR